MPFRAYCEIPKLKTVKSSEGSCPELFNDIKKELRGAEKIKFATFLFSNPSLFSFFRSLASQGTEIEIITLPLRGMDEKKVKVDGIDRQISKRELAEELFNIIREEKIKNLKLYFFPHIYLWFTPRYQRGTLPYSLHAKAVLAKFKNGTSKCIISSGNLATGDPFHSENLLIAENEPNFENVFQKFFEDLLKNSVPSGEYFKGYQTQADDFQHAVQMTDLDEKDLTQSFFTAPFYTINGVGSPYYAGKRIQEVISKAKNRILVCAQHFHNIESFNGSAPSIVKSVIEAKEQNPQLELKVLKQTGHQGLAQPRRAAITECILQERIKCEQKVNPLVHDKFIIADNTVVVSTANYTPTQFAWAFQRKIKYKFAGELHEKTSNFAEVNAFAILDDKKVVDAYVEHFFRLWDNASIIEILPMKK